jgi:hypothetical protein
MEVLHNGRLMELDALAREIQGNVLSMGGKLPTGEEEIESLFAAFDASAHITDQMNEEELGEFLEEFNEAWKRALEGPKTEEKKEEPPAAEVDTPPGEAVQ